MQAVTGPKEALLNSTELRLALRSEPYNEKINLLGCPFEVAYKRVAYYLRTIWTVKGVISGPAFKIHLCLVILKDLNS